MRVFSSSQNRHVKKTTVHKLVDYFGTITVPGAYPYALAILPSHLRSSSELTLFILLLFFL